MKPFSSEVSTSSGNLNLITKNIQSPVLIAPPSTSLKNVFAVQKTFTTTSPFYGKGLYETTNFQSFKSPTTGSLTVNRPQTTSFSLPSLSPSLRQRDFVGQELFLPQRIVIGRTGRSRERTNILPGLGQTNIFRPITSERLGQRQQAIQKQKLSIGSVNLKPSPFNYNLGFTPFGFNLQLPFAFPKPELSFQSGVGNIYKGKLRREYTPSIGAILTGVKAPKISSNVKFAEMTGFQARPVISRKASKKKTKR
jgi:hypothetical protein